MTTADLLSCAAICRETLEPALGRDWTVPAGDLEWDCRRTLDHIADALFVYAGYVARRATGRIVPPRNGDPGSSPAELLAVVETAAAILGEVIRGLPPGARVFHPAGMADATGYLGMASQEVLMHTDDIAAGLGIPFSGSEDLAAKIVARIFPWAPTGVSAWAALRWSAGRVALPGQPRQDENWYWHCPPLTEWDGTIKRRTAPPAWR